MPISSKINRYQQYDANSDSGYGRLEPKFHKPRTIPLVVEPAADVSDVEIDDDTYEAVLKKLLAYEPSDAYAKNKADPFHFVDGATRLSESTAKGMVPFPNMYKSRQGVAGGTAPREPAGPTAAFRTRIRPTGTKKGFSAAPYPQDSGLDSDENYRYSEIINQDLDQKHVDLLKKMVKLIHLVFQFLQVILKKNHSTNLADRLILV